MDNRELLNELIGETIQYCRDNPEDQLARTRLVMLLKAQASQYDVESKAWNDEQKNANEAKLQEQELKIRELELEETRKWHRSDFIAKLAGTAAATTTAVLAIKWESVGDFVHKIALTIGPKFRS